MWCLFTSDTLTDVADLQKRGNYTPRRAREQRAYRLAITGTVAGGVGVVSLVLAIAGVIGATLPLIALIIAAICAFGFTRAVGTR
jgi:CHASE2 domain-containing sensor protein